MAKIAKFNFFLAAPNLIIFLLRQIKFMAKKKNSSKKIEICFHTVNLLNLVFSLQNKTKVSFDVYDYTLFRKKSLKNTNKILECKIQSIVMTFGLFGFLVFSLLDGVSLQNNFEYLFDYYHSWEDTSVSFSALIPNVTYLMT